MKTISLDQVTAGMTLALDAYDRSGRLLVATNTEISDKQIRLMRMWGVSQVSVVNVDDEVASQNGEENTFVDLDKIESEVAELFRHTDIQSEVIQSLMSLCVKRRLES